MMIRKNGKWFSKLSVVLVLLMTLVLCAGCTVAEEESEETAEATDMALFTATDYVEFTIENYGTIVVELYGEEAPITVANFLKLVDEGFYDGLTFHRIISGFMIQGGDPNGNGMGGSAEKIQGEFSANGIENNILHVRGVLSMARSMAFDSASSQFFIMHQDAPHLDGQYAAFGRVISGIEVVDAICEKTPVTDYNGTVKAENQPVITSIVRTEMPEELPVEQKEEVTAVE